MDNHSKANDEYDLMEFVPFQGHCTVGGLWGDFWLINESISPEEQLVTAHAEGDQSSTQAVSNFAPRNTSAPGIAFRPRSVTSKEWERQRTIITQLYVHEECRLKDVMRIMRDQYGLVATAQMYKKKFKA